jgi:hypothetical protein
MRPASCRPCGVRNFEVAHRFLESICTTALVLSLSFAAVEGKEEDEDDNGDVCVYGIYMSILMLYIFHKAFLLEIFQVYASRL